jgi:hypothetical protein
MKEEVFAKRRQILSQDSRPVTVPGYILSYAIDGLPFMEPCFATCLKREHSPYPEPRPDVQGVAFLITESEFRRVLATEGGSGWNDGSCGGYRVSTVEAVDYKGNKLSVLTLTNLPKDNTRLEAYKNCPSQRYKKLIVNGAIESGVDPTYIKFLEGQEVYDRSKHGCDQSFALVIQVLFMLPFILWMLFGSALFIKILGRDRSPWIVVRGLYLYQRCVKAIVHPVLFFFCGSGYHNNTTSKIENDKSK